MLFGLVPAYAAETEDDRVKIDFSFDDMATNAPPAGLTVNEGTVLVEQPDEAVQNKVMTYTKPAGSVTTDISINSEADNIVYQFDFMMEDNKCAKRVILKDVAGKFSDAMTVNQDGFVTLSDNRKTARLSVGKWYRFALIYHYGMGRYELYMDGKCLASRIAIQNGVSFSKASILRFQSGSGEQGARFSIDNLRCYEGKDLLDDSAFAVPEFNPTVAEAPEPEELPEDTETIYLNTGFDKLDQGAIPGGWSASPKEQENVIQVEEFPDKKNKSLMIQKNTGTDPLIDATTSGFSSAAAVLEFSFYSEDNSSDKLVMLRDSAAVFNHLLEISAGGRLKVSGQEVGKYKKKTWHKIAMILDFSAKMIDVYLDDELKMEKVPFGAPNFSMPERIRFSFPGASAPGTFYIDDVRFYAGRERRDPEELAKAESTAASKGVQLITPQPRVESTMDGLVAMLVNDNTAYSGGEKKELDARPRDVEGTMYVPARFAVEGLGGQIAWDGVEQRMDITASGKEIQCWIGKKEAKLNGETIQLAAAPITAEDRSMLPMTELAEKLLGVPEEQNTHYGIMMLGGRSKTYSDKQVKDIYDLLIYTRPTKEQILKDFEPMKGKHPRIMATKEDFDRIREDVKTNEVMKPWYENLLTEAEKMLGKPHSRYEKPDGLRLLAASRQTLNFSYTLGMAYQLTGDTRYAQYLWEEYEGVCNFPDWNSANHFLDTAEMVNALAIGYDWCYDFWTEEQKKVIETGMMKFGLKEGEKCYMGQSGVNGDWVTWDWNWNQVCNGGLSVGALALLDVEPEFCSWLLETAFLSMENMLGEFAPDGAWKEGPGYWDYTVSYFVYHMAALDTTLGTDYGYFASNNIGQTAYFITYGESAQGTFNFHDAGPGMINSAQIFYFAKKLQDGSLARMRLNDMDTYNFNGGALDLLWFDPDNVSDSVKLWPDRKFGYTEMATFRSAFNDTNALFAGIHGGDNNVAHGNLDSGSFVLDAMGERWAVELGSDDYNMPGYFDNGNARWQYYRCNAQGQNVVALNPVNETGQTVKAFTEIKRFETKERGGFAVVDMTPAYGGKATKAYRGMKMDANRTQVVVQDELQLAGMVDLWWFMHTKADIEIAKDGKSAMLTFNGKQMYVVLDSNVKAAKFINMAAEPLPGSPNPSQQNKNSVFRKLAINLPKAKNKVEISVRFIPVYSQEMLDAIKADGIPKLQPIEEWKVEEGEIVKPELSGISIGGKAIAEFAPEKNMYVHKLPFGTKGAPEVTVQVDERFKAEITQAKNEKDAAGIKVYDKQDPKNWNYYTVRFNVLPIMGLPEEFERIPTKVITVSDEPQPENGKENINDGDLKTRWSAENEQWIQLDLGEEKDVSVVTMAFYMGSVRVSYYTIQVSVDGKNWKDVYSGESSGISEDYESYYIGEQKARYIRVKGYGNSSNSWNSYSEIYAYGR